MHKPVLSVDEARDLVSCLDSTDLPYMRFLTAHVVVNEIIFVGGAHGPASLTLSVSSRERVLAHWQGYVENNGGKALFRRGCVARNLSKKAA